MNELPISERPAATRASLDEQALDAELVKAEMQAVAVSAKANRWRRLRWVNQPITIWLLTTCAVGFLGFTYSNYSSCRTRLDADDSTFIHSMRELSFRSGVLEGLGRGLGEESGVVPSVPPAILSQQGNQHVPQPNPKARLSGLMQALDPNQTYQFKDFKGVFSDEIAASASDLVRKWHPTEARRAEDFRNATMRRFTQSLVTSGKGPADIRSLLAVYQSMGEKFTSTSASAAVQLADPGHFFDQFAISHAIYVILLITPTIDDESARGMLSWAERPGDELLGDERLMDIPEVAPVSDCLKRSVWPF
jgi:hypothetical protein